MLISLLTSVARCETWVVTQRLQPSTAPRTLFGKSIEICDKLNRLAIGAQYENVTRNGQVIVQMGCVYIYDYDEQKAEYYLSQRIEPPDDTSEVQVRQMGSQVQLSEDGSRLFIGSPYSNVIKGGGAFLTEVGAVVEYVYDQATRKYKHFFTHVPEDEDRGAGQGLGRQLDITPDGYTFAASYYNKQTAERAYPGEVFIATFDTAAQTWSKLSNLTGYPSDHFGLTIKIGSSLQFTSSNDILVGVEVNYDASAKERIGTYVFHRENGLWSYVEEIKSVIPPAKTQYKSYGTQIELLPDTKPEKLAVGIDGGSDWASYVSIAAKDSSGQWDDKLAALYELPAGFAHFDFISTTRFACSADSAHNENGEVQVMTIGKNGIKVEGVLRPPLKDQSIQYLQFGKALAWRNDGKVLLVGAHHFTGGIHGVALDSPAVYVVKRVDTDRFSRSDSGRIVGCVVAGLLIVGQILIVAITLVQKKCGSQKI